MSTVAGVFSETLLFNSTKRAEDMMFDDRIKQQYLPDDLGTLNAIKDVQTANLVELTEKKKDRTIQVEWMNACEVGTSDRTNCDIDGTELSTNVETLTLDIDQESKFQYDESDFHDNRFNPEEVVAKGLMKADKELVDYLSQVAVARLNTYRGVNSYAGNKATIVGSDTYIPSAYWTAEIMTYLKLVGIRNKFTSPRLLSGVQLYEQTENARAKAGNDNGKGDAVLYAGMPIHFDLFNIDTVNDPDLYVYMLSLGSLAMASKAYYTPQVTEYFDSKRWSMRSAFMPGIEYDVHYKNTCNSNTDFYTHQFKVVLKAGIFRNPTGCDEDNTGILTFICGTGA